MNRLFCKSKGPATLFGAREQRAGPSFAVSDDSATLGPSALLCPLALRRTRQQLTNGFGREWLTTRRALPLRVHLLGDLRRTPAGLPALTHVLQQFRQIGQLLP